MNMRTAWIITVLFMGAASTTPAAWGQAPPGMLPTPYGPMMAPPPPNPYGQPMMYPGAPTGYNGPQGPGMMPGGGMSMAMMNGPMPGQMSGPMGGPMPGYGPGEEGGYGGDCDGSCGDAGCDGRCGRRGNRLRHGIASHLISCFLPYDDGGCCAPHWFDVHAEYVNLRREDVSDTVNFMSAGPLGPIVLSTNDLDFDNQSGFRTTLSTQVGVGSNLEVSYLGQFNWSSSAQVTDPGNGLFSAFSQFGVIPNPGQGFIETDQASFASIAYSSSIDNLELNFRQRWQGYGCRLQGSWLAGVRYFQLKEQFIFTTLAPINNGSMEYDIGTLNQMTGFQIGGDIWACLLPGFSVGAEGKVGIYGNDASQQSLITATTVIPPLSERVRETEAAFLAEAGLMANWRVSQSWTFRGGYQFLYVNGVALAPENFNSTPPFLQNAFVPPTRVPVLNTGGDVFYHGLTAGFEYMW